LYSEQACLQGQFVCLRVSAQVYQCYKEVTFWNGVDVQGCLSKGLRHEVR